MQNSKTAGDDYDYSSQELLVSESVYKYTFYGEKYALFLEYESALQQRCIRKVSGDAYIYMHIFSPAQKKWHIRFHGLKKRINQIFTLEICRIIDRL